jgi:hypothetical protein
MSLQDIINNIQQDILNISTPVCIYVGVGTAGYMVFRENKVDDLYYHQYPKFLEEMHNSIENLTSIHILIDPMLESPPFITIDTSKGLQFNLNQNLNSNSYRTIDSKHIVYCLKQSVTMTTYPNYTGNYYVDITNELCQLNKLCIDNNILLVYNDYTGRPVKPLAEYMDDSIGLHLEHIIYGIGSRKNHGCYINLLDPLCKFAFFLEKHPMRDLIRTFNMNYIIKNNLNLAEQIEKYPITQIEYISASINAILLETFEEFNTNIFGILRPLHQLMTNKTNLEEFNKYLIENIKSIDPITLYFNEKKYSECFDALLHSYSSELKKVIYIKNIEISPYDLIKIITSNENCYIWIDTLKSILEI